MFISPNEVRERTPRLESYGAGRFTVTRETQQALLFGVLNVYHPLQEAQRTAGLAPEGPQVTLTYRKVTKAKPRIEGTDYRPNPGKETILHEGTLVRIARNKQGIPYLLIGGDRNREGTDGAGYTAVRLEGILTFQAQVPQRLNLPTL